MSHSSILIYLAAMTACIALTACPPDEPIHCRYYGGGASNPDMTCCDDGTGDSRCADHKNEDEDREQEGTGSGN